MLLLERGLLQSVRVLGGVCPDLLDLRAGAAGGVQPPHLGLLALLREAVLSCWRGADRDNPSQGDNILLGDNHSQGDNSLLGDNPSQGDNSHLRVVTLNKEAAAEP